MKSASLRPLLLFLVPLVSLATAQSPNCSAPMHLIVARGSGADPGLGFMRVVVESISEAVPGTTVEALEYPATFVDYFDVSQPAGVKEMARVFTSYVGSCPQGKVALLGFSQGAHVASDMVCGADAQFFEGTDELADRFVKNLVAVVMFGNPAHMADAPWNAGTSTRDGIFVRRNPEDCEPYVSKMRSWCDTGDIYCDSGDDEEVHVSYVEKYADDATEFVVSMYKQGLESNDSCSASPSPSPTITPITTTATNTDAAEATGTGNGDDDSDEPEQVSGANGASVVVSTGAIISLMVGVSIMLAW